MPGRKYLSTSSAKYRYSINGQEKESELNENITTAEFWEYDSRIIRRWNVDPKPTIGVSTYSCFANNPIAFSDPKGDTLEIRNSNGKLLGSSLQGEGNYVLALDKNNDAKWEKMRKDNFKSLNERKLSSSQLLEEAKTQGNVYDINSAISLYKEKSGTGEVLKINDAPIANMTNITINGNKATTSQLKSLIKREKLGPEWGARWSKNSEGIMQLGTAKTDNDLTSFSTGSNLAHLHPNASKIYIITFNYKMVGDKVNRSGYAAIAPNSPVDGIDQYEAKQFQKSWNTVIERGVIHFYNGDHESTFQIKF